MSLYARVRAYEPRGVRARAINHIVVIGAADSGDWNAMVGCAMVGRRHCRRLIAMMSPQQPHRKRNVAR